ncbi:class I SAM-dependent methyltransferase [Dehalococcoidia bacterium]|nr:class I SAM-dependent methyltransferase [Dehalococcoidia bacterium]
MYNKFVLKVEKNCPNPGYILDIGCGVGHDLRYLDECGWKVYGIDNNVEKIEKAKTSCGVNGVQVGDILQLPFPSEFFDAVYCRNVLHYLNAEEIPVAVNESLRVLKKEGYFFFMFFSIKDKVRHGNTLFLSEEEIDGYFGNWTLIEKAEVLVEESHGGAGLHEHTFWQVIGKK